MRPISRFSMYLTCIILILTVMILAFKISEHGQDPSYIPPVHDTITVEIHDTITVHDTIWRYKEKEIETSDTVTLPENHE